jgi:tetratricopeptide (TPR) repeat protein
MMLHVSVMRIPLRSLLFALVLPACGGDREAPTVTTPTITEHPPETRTASSVPPPGGVSVAEPQVKIESVHAIAAAIPTSFDDAMTQGRALAEKGEHAGALELFAAAIELDARRAEPHLELARLHIAMNAKAQAVIEANKAVKLAPSSSQAWNTKGRAELLRFSYDDAIAAFTKATELNHDNVWAWNNLGYTQLQLKKYGEAVVSLTEATTRKGAAGYMFNNLGTALEQLDRLDEARLAFEQGGKLGSKESLASRKRLDGVKSIALAKQDTRGKIEVDDHTFELDEGKPEDARPAGDDPQPATDEDAPAEPKPDTGGDDGSDPVKPVM